MQGIGCISARIRATGGPMAGTGPGLQRLRPYAVVKSRAACSTKANARPSTGSKRFANNTQFPAISDDLTACCFPRWGPRRQGNQGKKRTTTRRCRIGVEFERAKQFAFRLTFFAFAGSGSLKIRHTLAPSIRGQRRPCGSLHRPAHGGGRLRGFGRSSNHRLQRNLFVWCPFKYLMVGNPFN